MMAKDVKKTKAEPAPKKEAVATEKSAPAADTAKAEDPAKAADTPAKAADSTTSEAAGTAPKNYSRGEGQKPVTQAYKDNWNAIFANKTDKKKKKR
jgi:hypothetical protein